MIDLYSLCELYIESQEEMQVWDNEQEKTVFSGTFHDAQFSEFSDAEVGSFGIENGVIVVNIN